MAKNYMLYTKSVKVKKEGKEITFQKFLTKINERKTLETQLSNACKESITKQMAKHDYSYPVMIDVTKHFIKTETYNNKKGETKKYDVLVILECEVLSQATFKQRTIDDIIAELDTQEPELPF